MGGAKKEYRLLPGTDTTVLSRTVSAFIAFPCISRILITVPEEGEAAARQSLQPGLSADIRIGFVTGGSTRRESVHNALVTLSAHSPGYVLIHDGCRPFVSARLIQSLMDAVQECQAVIPLLPLTDTPKEISPEAGAALPVITRHLRRDYIGLAQTPQVFAFDTILAAHKAVAGASAGAVSNGREYTDDAEIWSEFYGPVSVVRGESKNRKITFPEDFEM